MKKKQRIVLATTCAALTVTAAVALDSRLTTRVYTVTTEKIGRPVRLALLTDLHCCGYGRGQRTLLDAVESRHPDLVLLGGDIFDDDPSLDEENAWCMVRALAEAWPTFYVTGNHEYLSGRVGEIKARMAVCGVTVLAGGCDTVLFQGQPFNLCGIDDPLAGEELWRSQLQSCSAQADRTYFTLLLTHRPERIEDYGPMGFDLILAGHAHGGQWRIPGILNGLLAPHQGLFPTYAGGCYDLDGTKLVVSRGLARESTPVPRVFNRPELVIIDVTPSS